MSRRRDLLVGLGIGAVGMAVIVALMGISGAVDSGGFGLDLVVLVSGLVVFGIAAVVEELVFRRLVLGGLVRLTGSAWLALVLSAALFGLVHLVTTAGATTISVLSTTLGGVMYGLAFLRSGGIWMGVGIHVAWNVVQGTVLGFPVSGEDRFSGALWHLDGGGAYGPESSVLSLLGRVVIIALVLWVTRRASRDRVAVWTSGSAS